MYRNHLFHSCGKIGSYLYCLSAIGAILMRMNLHTQKVDLIGNMHAYAILPQCNKIWYGSIAYIKYGDSLYLPETHGMCMTKYNTITGKSEFIPWLETEYTNNGIKYVKAVLFNDHIFIFPRYGHEICIYDVNKDAFVTSIDLPDLSPSYAPALRMYGGILAERFVAAIRVRDDVWMFSGQERIAVCFSLNTRLSVCHVLPAQIASICDVTYGDAVFYILDLHGNIFAWNGEGEDCREIVRMNCPSECFYQRVLVTKKNIWLLPGFGTEITIYDRSKGTVSAYREYPPGFSYNFLYPIQAKYYGGCEDNDTYYLAMNTTNYMLTVDKHTGKPSWIRPVWPTPHENAEFFQRSNLLLMKERYMDDVSLLLEYADIYARRSQSMKGIGQSIWQYLSEDDELSAERQHHGNA